MKKPTVTPTFVRVVGMFAVLLGMLLGSSNAWAGVRNTAFNPNTHGFNFVNSFNNDVVKELDIRTGGLCGGMVYGALDYFSSRTRSVTSQNYRPANRTTLQSYLYNRQVDSIIPNVTKWGEIGFNPGGARNAEFFRWGMTSEFANLRAKIDRGQPAPIGVHGVGGSTHQILAIGYTTDRRNRLTEIRVYDPNFPNEIIRMRPDLRRKWFQYVGKSSASDPNRFRWRTYFVDKSYRPKTPPALATPNYPNDGKIREFVVFFNTGADDLRGGNDNVDMIIRLRNGTAIRRSRINLRARWLRDYTEAASVKVSAIRKSDIASVEFVTSFGGGVGGDNWDTKSIDVTYYERGNQRRSLIRRKSFFRFTGSRRSLRLNLPSAPAPAATPSQVTKLEVKIKTGGDDLRGNEDNLDIQVLFRDGSTKSFRTVNNRERWPDKQFRTVSLDLGRGHARSNVVGLKLSTTFRGGMGGDNWNMDEIEVTSVTSSNVRARYVHRSGKPVKRFTGSSKTFTLKWF